MPAAEVSVVIPTRNRGDFLRGAVTSAARQEDVDLELIVVDDGSDVPVSERELTAAVPVPVRVLRQPGPHGVARARNAGIAAAEGAWVAFLDDDDLWAPAKLRTQLDAAAKEDVTFAYASGVVIDARGRIVASMDASGDDHDLHAVLLRRNSIPCGCSNLLARTDAIRALDGFDPALSIFADWDLHLRLSAAADGIGIPERVIAYTIHDGSMHLDEEAVRSELSQFYAKHAEERARHGVGDDRTDYLRWRAGSYRAAGDRRRAATAFWRLAVAERDPRHGARALALRVGLESLLQQARARRRHAPDNSAPAWLASVLADAGRMPRP